MFYKTIPAAVAAAGLLAATPATSTDTQPSFADQLFPPPTEGIHVPGTFDGGSSLLELMSEFSRVTGISLQVSPLTRNQLREYDPGLLSGVDVPPERVYAVVEGLLVASGFALVPLSPAKPQVFAVVKQFPMGSGDAMADLLVDEADLDGFADHAAVQITTAVTLENTDARQLVMSLRVLSSDRQGYALASAGSSNTLIITGHANRVVDIVGVMRLVDERTPPPAPAPDAPSDG